jgi:Ca-activated chloride channel family protein
MTFHNPLILLLLILIVPIVLWYVKRHAIKEQSIRMSSIGSYKGGSKSWRVRLRHIPFVLRMMAFALVVIVLARPQSSNSWQNRTKEGIDIIMTMDISGTMLAEDLKPNRLKAAKNVAIDFIKNRPNDNIGLVLFQERVSLNVRSPMTITS